MGDLTIFAQKIKKFKSLQLLHQSTWQPGMFHVKHSSCRVVGLMGSRIDEAAGGMVIVKVNIVPENFLYP